MSNFCFHSISGEQMGRISPNFVYAFILTISRLGLLPVIFSLFVTDYLWSLSDGRILFLLNVFRFSCSISSELDCFTA